MRSRVIVSVLLAASFLAGPVVLSSATPAHADGVASAEARVARLQLLVRQTTDRLVNGTEQWEKDQAALRKVQARQAGLSAKVRRQEAVAAAGRARVAVVARRMYMHPVDDQLRMALGMNPDEVLGLLRTQGELGQVVASDNEVVRRAKVAQLELTRTRLVVSGLARDAQRLAAQSARRMHELQALASDTSRRLSEALTQLGSARAARAARLEQLRQARARAARLRYVAPTGAACKGGSTAGQSNGQLDPASLCPLWMAPGQRLRGDAAHAFNLMSQYHAKVLGRPLCVTDSYRSYARQVDVYRRKPGLAAVPGTSKHGWGLAVDLGCGVQQFGSPAFTWMKRNAPRFGFAHPAWAEPSGSMPEAWHWEFQG